MPKPEYEEIVPYPFAYADQNLQRTIMIAVDEESMKGIINLFFLYLRNRTFPFRSSLDNLQYHQP